MVQVLNIVVPESRILASRERCPYLVRLEVADTGIEGSDARLYAPGPTRAGATVEEALNLNSPPTPANAEGHHAHQNCQIPPELIEDREPIEAVWSSPTNCASGAVNSEAFPRGGYQVHANGTDFVHENPYDRARQHQYEQLHQQMQESPPVAPPEHVQVVER